MKRSIRNEPFREVLRAGAEKAGRSLARPYRLATSKERILPDFLIIGAQKSGTTSLHAYLAQHPSIVPSSEKEIHFFADNWRRGLSWYRAFFPTKRRLARVHASIGTALTGEATPYYLLHPLAPERARQVAPTARILAVLREPVDRAYSHYHHEVRGGHEELPFAEALDREAERVAGEAERLASNPAHVSFAFQHHTYLTRGLYLEQILRWEKHFGRDAILVLSYDELNRDPQRVMRSVHAFLGIEERPVDAARRHNTGRYERMDPDLRARLRKHFEPHNAALFRHLGVDYEWNR